MANFELAYQYVMRQQGMYQNFFEKGDVSGDQILCSLCFNDEGLRLDSTTIGIDNTSKCINCGKSDGKKLTRPLVRHLCYRFFVRGTIERFEFGGFPLIQMNELRFNDSNIHVSPWLEQDVKLIEQAGEIGLFYYGPRLWMLGEIEPLKSLQKEEEIDSIIERILQIYPVHLLNENHPFYRIRLNPDIPHDSAQYDSPPQGYGGNNRFDDNGEAGLYASPDLELCIHECRATVEDDMFVAKLVPKAELKMINLSAVVREEGVTEFTSLDLAIHFLFLAGKHSYPICSRIAKRIREEGFDGIIYPSYFSYARTGAIPFDTIQGMSIRLLEPLQDFAQAQSVPNIFLFGRPIEDKKVLVYSINKVIINSIKYETSFGPAYHENMINKKNTAEIVANRRKELEDKVLKSFNLPTDDK
ncbi:RES family NAD+ phosphorylase [Mucilaginibacter sp. dw_454]|uniref:RES family NAD+ phosphorylase n=1 Tax=Mucilaginibacter sp. dw_454 TaxID=2720079 RepID=UPI001BD53A38|nr:RES family NAD+ phosphorylase [Mucilaginibacter sp. dw_454]